MSAVNDGVPAKRKRARRDMRKVRDPQAHRGRSPAAKARRTGQPCGRCGQHHVNADGKPTCNGHRKRMRPYQPCTRMPVAGAAVCPMHGGKAAGVRERAEMRLFWQKSEGDVAALLAECDLPEQHPIDGLLEVVRHSGAMMRLLGVLVSELDLDSGEVKISVDDYGKEKRYTRDDKGLFGYNTAGDQATHVLVTMYGHWADRYSRACKLALDANIDERIVRNAEATTNAVYTSITRALDKANLTPQQAADFSKTLADEMRKLVGPLDLGRGQTA